MQSLVLFVCFVLVIVNTSVDGLKGSDVLSEEHFDTGKVAVVYGEKIVEMLRINPHSLYADTPSSSGA